MPENNLLDSLKKATETKLNADFVVELISCMFTSQKIFDIAKQHLQYHYLQSDPQKRVVKYLYDTQSLLKSIPTIGMVAQAHLTNKDVLALLGQIKKITITNDQHEAILKSFEDFIKKSKLIAAYTKVGELFNQGKQDEAASVMLKEAEIIAAFSLKSNYYTRVFADFEKTNEKRIANSDKRISKYAIFGIPELDNYCRGIEYGRSALLMARSGGGKSTAMKWVGLCNARLGKRVIHFQAEGTEEEALTAYHAGFTGINLDDMEMGNIPATKRVKILKAHRDILGNNGEIFLYASEQFDQLSIDDCKEIIADITKLYGSPDLIIFDYMEKFSLKGTFYNSEAGERKRRSDLGDKITNIATMFGCAVLTAIQANSVAPSDYNKSDFVLTRSSISEYKAAINPFSYFITINATDDESEAGIARLFCDKMRKNKRGKLIRIYQALDQGRFYDAYKTSQTFYTGLPAA